jgi:hypothetical protein
MAVAAGNRGASARLYRRHPKEIAMRIAPCVLAVVLAVTAAGCARYEYDRGYAYGSPGYSTSYVYGPPGYSPNYAYAPQYSNETPASRYGYYSKWDYYRNYGGTYHPGPEQYP